MIQGRRVALLFVLGFLFLVCDTGLAEEKVGGPAEMKAQTNPYRSEVLFATFLGGKAEEIGMSLAVDGEGNLYVAINTASPGLPTTERAYQRSYQGGERDIYVAKLNPEGTQLLYATYLGGKGEDFVAGIAVDGAGHAYVTGWTSSANFPATRKALGKAFRGGGTDAFVVKLSPNGSALVYSTFLGGSGDEAGQGIAVDGTGHAYVTGWTSSANFPTTGKALGKAFRGGGTDAFVVKLSPDGSALVYSTFLGGGGDEAGQGIAVDGAGHAYVIGKTTSQNFPTVSPLQAGLAGQADAFVAKLNPEGSALLYATYLGGKGEDYGTGIAVDGTGHASVTGRTFSTDFPTVSPLQKSNAGDSDAFIAKLNPTGSALVYSTYLGGKSSDLGMAIAVDKGGNAYVIGSTYSTDFPTVHPVQSSNGYAYDAFVAVVNPPGTALLFSTYLGGEGYDWGHGIALDGAGRVYVTGYTNSTLFPTARPLQAQIAGDADAFVAKLAPIRK